MFFQCFSRFFALAKNIWKPCGSVNHAVMFHCVPPSDYMIGHWAGSTKSDGQFGFVSNWFTEVYPTWKKAWKNTYTQHKRRGVFSSLESSSFLFSNSILLSFVGGYSGCFVRKSLEDWIKGAGLTIFWSLSHGDFSSKGIGGFPTETSRKLGRNSGVPPQQLNLKIDRAKIDLGKIASVYLLGRELNSWTMVTLQWSKMDCNIPP